MKLNREICVICFYDAEDVDNCIEKANLSMFEGNVITVSKDFSDDVSDLYDEVVVSNLMHGTNSKTLKKMLSRFGKIRYAKIPKENKDIGFVSFEDPQCTVKAMY